VLQIYGMSDRSENSVKALFYNNIFPAREAIATSKTYNQEGVEKIILLLHEYNLKSIGINSTGTNDADLLKELLIKIIY
jgi:DNA polymerase-3 subunit delta